MGIREHMGIEDKDDAQACKSIDTKLDGSGDNNIFFGKVNNQEEFKLLFTLPHFPHFNINIKKSN